MPGMPWYGYLIAMVIALIGTGGVVLLDRWINGPWRGPGGTLH